MTRIYAIYDSKAVQFAPPFFVNNDEVAKRTLCHTFLNVGRCPLTDYPADFTLFALGEFDEDTGEILSFEAKQNLGTVLEITSMMLKSRETPEEVGDKEDA